ncbi:MAG: diguanylate cyclase [Chloroflexi bacterium]|nr:diguanylate cyclase [Chloroflexota bacterium]
MNAPKILVADDRADDLDLLTDVLNSARYHVITASDGEEALAKAYAERPELIILDIRMPKMDGFQVCRRVKGDPDIKSIPVILLSSTYRDSADKLRGFEAGADDYVTQPVRHKELIARIGAMLRIKALYDERTRQQQALEKLTVELKQTNAALLAANEELAQLAATDPLTGLYTREHFYERLESEFARARRFRHGLTIVRADIDQFHALNERLGRAAGDHVLRAIGTLVQEISRTMDIAARIGGDEFGLILPETDIAGAQSVAHRFRDAIRSRAFLPEPAVRITITQGLAASNGESAEMAEDIMRRAETALRQAKALGSSSIGVEDDTQHDAIP